MHPSWDRHLLDHVADHLLRRSVRGCRVRPEPDAVAEDERRELLNVFGIHLGPAALQERPHLGEPAPADDRARRRAKIDATLDQLRRRMLTPLGVRIVRTRRGDQALDVFAQAIVQEHPLS